MAATDPEKAASTATTDAASAFKTALALLRGGDSIGADALCAKILRASPAQFDALHLRGLIALDRGDSAVGIGFIRQSLAVNPNHAIGQSNLGLALFSAGEPQRALESFERALLLEPNLLIAHYNRANALRSLGEYEQALAAYDSVLAINGQYVPALNNRALVLDALGRFAEARESLERARAADSRYAPAQENLAAVLLKLKEPTEALAVSARLLQWSPGNVAALCTQGNALLALERFAEAVQSYTSALGFDPKNFDALLARGAAYQQMGRVEDALADCEAALQIRPDSARALINCGNDHLTLGDAPRALIFFERALAVAPEEGDALHGRGAALLKSGRDEEAAQAFEDVLKVQPDHGLALEQLFHLRMNACDWRDLAGLRRRLHASLQATHRFANPLTLLMQDQPDLALTCARAFAASKHPPDPALGPRPPPSRPAQDRRIRVAYISADFRTHPVAQSLVGVLERHDRSRFEVFGVSLGAPDADPFTQRVQAAFDRFADVSRLSDRAVAHRMREWGVDIAVDLMGFTEGLRLGIFAHRAAPIQAGFLGYAGTSGAPYIDFILADSVAIPPGFERFYTEHVVRLPHCFLPTDDQRELPAAPSRAEAGLPPRGIVLCAFTRSHKITPEVFEIWMRLLHATPASLLWLRDMGPKVRANLLEVAAASGVEAHRLVFAPHASGTGAHLARQQLADLFLDTLPYNAHSTACDALWAGVPVLSCAGAGFASRVAASALTAAGLPELIAPDLATYERAALKLLHEPDRLRALRSRLASQRSRAPLFDTARFTRHLESAYLQMCGQAVAGVLQAFDVCVPHETSFRQGSHP